MRINVKVKKGSSLSGEEIRLMNKSRVKEFGKKEAKNFKKDYPMATNYFFVKDQEETVAFGLLRPIKISYLGKSYSIFGFCSIISLEKGKGYGRILIKSMIRYLKKKKKTGLGFCSCKVLRFYEKSGFKVEKDFIRRFRYKNPVTGKIEVDNNGDGLYINGKDNFIKNVLSTDSIVYTDIPFW